ncbi:MAG: segregation/condensation protein A [Planctomycetota bacterium]
MADYKVELESFHGPLDLLLYLVKREEVDILDIPIARVTDQFLVYLNVLELVDVERAGDFLVTAATLMEIKSKILLPREAGAAHEEDDPRLELVKQLIEYKKYKDAASLLDAQAQKHLLRMPRSPLEKPNAADAGQQPLRRVELWDLVSAFGRLIRETVALQPRQIVMDETPMSVHMERIEGQVRAAGRLPFKDVFTAPLTRGRLLGLFLAILELIKTGKIQAEQSDMFGEIWIELKTTAS